MRHFGLQERFKDLLITRSLKTDTGADLEFTYGSVKGRILVKPLPESGALPDPRTVVEAQIRKQAKSCRSGSEVINTDSFSNGFFSKGLSCKDAGGSYLQFLGGNYAGSFVMLAAVDPDGLQKGNEFAWRMSAAAREVFLSSSDTSAFKDVQCDVGPKAVGSQTVAVELIKVSEANGGLKFAVRDGSRPSEDRWSMSTGMVQSELLPLLSASGDGPWMTYTTIRTPKGIRFQSQLYAKIGTGCKPALEQTSVDATDLPNVAVKAFARLAGIETQPSNVDIRSELRIWAASNF